jgi:hypothetical protein
MTKKYAIYLGAIGLGVTAVLLIGWRRRAATVAARFIDQKEIGQNSGFADAAFEKMLRDVGWQGGEAWCMYFAKSVYMQAFPNKADQINRVLTGSTQQSWKNAIDNPGVFRVITDGPARKGDIVIWQSTKNPTLGHAGIVERKKGIDDGITVEGNSGLGDTREGEGVSDKQRELVPGAVMGSLKLLGFIRLRA